MRNSLDPAATTNKSSIMPNVYPMGLDSDSSPIVAGGTSTNKKNQHHGGMTDFSSQFVVNPPSTIAQSKLIIQRSQITAENNSMSDKPRGGVVRKSHTKTGSMMVESPEVSSATMNIETNSNYDQLQ